MKNGKNENSFELPEIQHRVFRATKMILERRITDYFSYLLLSKYRDEFPNTIPLPFVDDLDPDEKQILVNSLTRMSDLLDSFSETFNLEGSSKSLRQHFRAQSFKTWEDLENSYSKQLRGYGELDRTVGEKLDDFITQMKETNGAIINLFTDR